MQVLQWLDHLDKIIFVLINHDSDHYVLDNLMLILRNPYSWVPLYCFLLWYILKKRKSDAWPFIFLSILTFAITDSVSASVLKPFFERPRPCSDPLFHGMVRNLVDCGGYYSFPSSHAANHFGLATFWYWSIWQMTGKKWKWLWIWALLIGYAQIYVGKHYPFDIAAGAIFGWMIGILSVRVFSRWAFPFGREKQNRYPDKEKAASAFFQNRLQSPGS
jgi:membrane-associated phospholipid phosphatase